MTLPLFRGHPDCPFRWTPPKYENAQDRISWLRRALRDTARMITVRIYYRLEEQRAYDLEVTVAMTGLCQRLGWPLSLAIAAADAERPDADQAAVRHAQTLRRAIWPLAQSGMAGSAILAAARQADDGFDCCLSNNELLEVTRQIAHAAARQRGRRRAA